MPSEQLPSYAAPNLKAELLASGASGTIYALVMPESEAALLHLTRNEDGLLDRYREPWTQKQDSAHQEYFETWLEWSAPIVRFDAAAFPFRYPTAGASEGIFKLIAEYVAQARNARSEPTLHMFVGEYEGFPAFADALNVRCVRHDRADWQNAIDRIDPGGMFWISQPSAIDGAVWPYFAEFAATLAERRADVILIPDLTYVGSVAEAFTVTLNAPNIPAFVFSHSKPFGGYYHRVGGVFARREYASLFGNRWFKNLLSLAWGTEMMRRHTVFDLPRKYRTIQAEAARLVGRALGISLRPSGVSIMATANPDEARSEPLKAVLRGSEREQVVRLCLTPAMTCLIDPAMAPVTRERLASVLTGEPR